jgi:hypothetical protein
MKGLWVLLRLGFSAFRLQRWILYAGVVMTIFLVIETIERGTGSWMVVAAAQFSLFVGMPAMLVAPFLFRSLSASRTHNLLPKFRLRMITAALLTVLTISASMTLWLAGSEILVRSSEPVDGVAAVVAETLILSFFGATAVYMCVFFAQTSATRWGLLFFPAAVIGIGPIVRLLEPVPWVALGLVALGWCGFAAAYIGGMSVWPTFISDATGAGAYLGGMPVWSTFIGDATEFAQSRRERPLSERKLERLAARPYPTILQGHISVERHRWLLISACIGVLLSQYMVWVLPWPVEAAFDFLVVICALLIPCFSIPAAFAANRIARRSRYLWLGGGQSRKQLYARAERECLFVAAAFAVFNVAYAIPIITMRSDWTAGSLAGVVIYAAISALPGCYFGLMLVNGAVIRQSAILAVIVTAGWLYVGFTINGIAGIEASIASIALVLASTLVFRRVAVARWRAIDWISFKPFRSAAQARRSPG